MRLDLPLPQIATGDLDIPIFGQLPSPNLPFRNEFEPGPVKVVGFEAAFRRWGLGEQNLEDAPGNPHHALIFAHADAELDDGALRVPPGVGRKAEEHEPNRKCSANVLTRDGPRCRVPFFVGLGPSSENLHGWHPRLEI